MPRLVSQDQARFPTKRELLESDPLHLIKTAAGAGAAATLGGVAVGGGIGEFGAASAALTSTYYYVTESQLLGPLAAGVLGYLIPEGSGIDNPFEDSPLSFWAAQVGEQEGNVRELFDQILDGNSSLQGASTPVTPNQCSIP